MHMASGYHLRHFAVRIVKATLPPDLHARGADAILQAILCDIRSLMCPRNTACVDDRCMLHAIQVAPRLCFLDGIGPENELVITLQHNPPRNNQCDILSAIATVTIGRNGQRISVYQAEIRMDALPCDLRALFD